MNKQLKKIIDDLNARMSNYHSSVEPTNDEVTIAWLLMHINVLEKKVATSSALIHFIEENNVTDDYADDGDGYTASWRSTQFSRLLDEAKA